MKIKKSKPTILNRLAALTRYTIEAALTLYSSGRYTESLSVTKKILGSQPKNIVAWNIAGICLQCLDKVQDAEKAYRRALSLQPD